jgi:hypothetical protein
VGVLLSEQKVLAAFVEGILQSLIGSPSSRFGKRLAVMGETYLHLPPEVTHHQLFVPVTVALVVSVAILLAALVFFKRPWAAASPRIPR